MDYFLESHLPHAIQFMKSNLNDEGYSEDRLYPTEITIVIPAGTDSKHTIKVTQEQHDFLERNKDFKALKELKAFGVRWVTGIPNRMLSDSEQLAEMRQKMNELRAENNQLKAQAGN